MRALESAVKRISALLGSAVFLVVAPGTVAGLVPWLLTHWKQEPPLLGLPVLQSPHSEATALGAAFLAGLKVGIWPNVDALRKLLPEGRRFEPNIEESERKQRLALWHRAVQAVIGFYTAKI